MKLEQLLDKNKIFFTSDTHFYHKNIIHFCNRPFKDVHEMNDKIIQNWNEIVPDDGIVFHLGDVALKARQKSLNDILHQLNGVKYLIKGNHEKSALNTEYLKSHWEGIFDILDINVYDEDIKHKQQKIVLCHYAMLVWNGSHRGSWNLFGHSHGNLGKNHSLNQLDVGVDCHNFYPISYEQVKNKIII